MLFFFLPPRTTSSPDFTDFKMRRAEVGEYGLDRFYRFNHADGDLEDTDFVDNSEFLICTHDTGNSSVRLLRLRKEFPVSYVIT